MRDKKRWFAALWTCLILLTLAAILLLPSAPSRLVPVFLLLWLWPILPWACLIPGTIIERLALSAGLVLILNTVGTLLLAYIPGPVSSSWLLSLAAAVNLLPLIIWLVSGPGGFPAAVDKRRDLIITLVLILLLGLGLRLANFTYKELQGDEGVVLVRAAEILTGDDDQIFLHQKGPMEILVPMVSWGMTGTIDDITARIPFLWAGGLGLLAIYLVSKRWFGVQAGLLACLFLGINGFGIAFSRIVQYQALVILWSLLAMLAATRYRDSGRTYDMAASVIFMGAGLLAHWDALLFAPAVGWLLWAGVKSKSSIPWPAIAGVSGLGLLLVLAFYLPYIRTDTFAQILNYLLDVRVGTGAGGSPFSWSGLETWRMSTFYNSTWYVAGLLIFGGIGIFLLTRFRRGLSPITFFVLPAVFYLFVVQDPRTHVYTIFPGLCILAAYGTVSVWDLVRKQNSRPATWLFKGIGITWLIVATVYPYLLFADISVERQRNWESSRPPSWLNPVTWSEPPKYGLFGFPHQAGWRVVADLLDDGSLPYLSNEEEEITNFYTRQAARTYCQDYHSVIRAADVQDEIPLPANAIEKLFLQTEVTVHSKPMLQLFGREEVLNPKSIQAEGTRRWLSPEEVRAPDPPQIVNIDVVLGEKIRLLGYNIDSSQVNADGYIGVTLYWEAVQPIERNYQVFVHLLGDKLLTQHDGAPECAMNPTTHWEMGEIVRDPHILPLSAEIPAGTYRLEAGMYDLLSLDRLSVEDDNDNSIYLARITID